MVENESTSVTKPSDMCEDGKVGSEEEGNILIVRPFKEQIVFVFVWQMKRDRKHKRKV